MNFDPSNVLPNYPISINFNIYVAIRIFLDFWVSDISKADLNDYVDLVQLVLVSLESFSLSGFAVEVLAQDNFEFDN